MECIFCKIISGDIPSAKVFEDENTFVFLDVNPIARGHCLVVPKKHYENIFDIDQGILRQIISAAKTIAGNMQEKLEAAGVNLVNASGKSAEQSVFHFHLHVVPRYENDGLHMNAWWQTKVKNPTLEELKALAQKLA